MLGKVGEMDLIQEALLNELVAKTARIEANVEHQKEVLKRIENSLVAMEPIKQEVHRHSLIIKGFSWFIGIIVSLFSAKYIGKF